MRRKVLFLCTHNSARSQMAEAWLRQLGGSDFEAHSAGSVATEVRSEAEAVMAEAGVDMSVHVSKTLDRFLYQPFDLVVTVCDNARDSCPTFASAGQRLHWSVADPAAVEGSGDERLKAFRSARDELRRRVLSEIVSATPPPSSTEHFRKLERMYLAAPTNAYYRPEIEIGSGEARIDIVVRPEFLHAAGGVHGSVYFKALDDACFFAVSSLVEGVFVFTTQFNIYLSRSATGGRLLAQGRVRHTARSSYLAAGELRDDSGRLLARGEGTFVRSGTRLEPGMGYR